MTSRSSSPLTREDLVAGERRPARAAGDPGATATNTGGRACGRVYGAGRSDPASVPSARARRARCCSPSPAASAPASRWRSRRSRGWCASFEPPVYCYHEIVHNRLVVDRFRELGRDLRRRRRRRPRRRAAHALGPRLGARGRRRGPRQGPLRRERGVPARHQGAPRGARCGPARASRSSTSATPATTRPSARSRSRPTRSGSSSTTTTSTRVLADGRRPDARSRCSRRRRSRTTTGRASLDAGPRAVPRALDRDPQRPVLRDHQPPGRAAGDRGRAPTPSS